MLGLSLQDILAQVGLDNLESRLKQRLTNALEHEAGRRGGELLGRALCESVDQAMETEGLPLEQRLQIGAALAGAMAEQLENAAAELRAYAPLQAAVVQAKAGTGDLREARRSRNAGTSDVKAALAAVVPEG